MLGANPDQQVCNASFGVFPQLRLVYQVQTYRKWLGRVNQEVFERRAIATEPCFGIHTALFSLTTSSFDRISLWKIYHHGLCSPSSFSYALLFFACCRCNISSSWQSALVSRRALAVSWHCGSCSSKAYKVDNRCESEISISRFSVCSVRS